MKGMTLSVLLAGGFLSACEQPRSAAYFHAHPAEGNVTVAACTSGQQRGKECDNADVGVEKARVEAKYDRMSAAFQAGYSNTTGKN